MEEDGAWPCSEPSSCQHQEPGTNSSRKATLWMLRGHQNPHRAAPKVLHSSQSVPEQPPKSLTPHSLSQAVCPPMGQGYGNMSSLTLHSPSHLLEGQYVEQDTKKGSCQPLASLFTLTAIDLPRSFQDYFQPSMWKGATPGEKTPILARSGTC